MAINEKILAEINEARQSGLYSVATLKIFDGIEELKIDENLQLHLDYTQELVMDFFNELMILANKTPGLNEYLYAIKAGDIIDNQKLEKESSFLIGLYYNLTKETAIDELIKYTTMNKTITGKDILKLNQILLAGTSSETKELIRTQNDKFVGRFINGERIIEYFPIDYKEIEEATNKLAELYNKRLSGEAFNNIFIQPFIIHGLFGALQIFSDGNTRIGRLMQHTLMWQLINEKTEFNFELPPLYATRSYYPFREAYRQKITALVKGNQLTSWTDWLIFNLKRVEDNVYASRENVAKLKKTLK